MFKISPLIKKSCTGAGPGIFSTEVIEEGQVVYYPPEKGSNMIKATSTVELDAMEYEDKLLYDTITKEGYLDKSGTFIYIDDYSKYIRHSDNPNLEDKMGTGVLVAKRKILKGEELFEDYRMTCDPDWVDVELFEYSEFIKLKGLSGVPMCM